MKKLSKPLGAISITLAVIHLIFTAMELRSALIMRQLTMLKGGITPGLFESAPQNAIMMRSSILALLLLVFGCLAVFSKKQQALATKVLLGLYALSVVAAAGTYLILKFA